MKTQNNTTTFFLSWSITKKEKKEQIQKVLITVAIPLIILGIMAATIGYPGLFTDKLLSKGIAYILYDVFFMIVVIAAAVFLFFLVNKIFPYAERSYFMDDSGINITKGKKNKKYSWDEFECYYPYSERSWVSAKVVRKENENYIGQSYRDTIHNEEKNLIGDIFYLKKKGKNFISKIYKKFVVVYGEAENSSTISRFLAHNLPRKTMTNTSDLGMVFYEFK